MSPDPSRRPAPAAADLSGEEDRRSRSGLAILGSGALLVTLILVSLGIWQVQRLSWKLDLIARVDARVHASPVPAPAAWPAVTADADEYRHVSVSGSFRHAEETLVQASTELGPGFWVMTPLVTDRGTTVLINRGFVPPDRRDPGTRRQGQSEGVQTVIGLLRVTEPKGGFLRDNAPADDRWYSRDVEAISTARGLTRVAPYFIDADATPTPGGYPVGGLTRVVFPNSHMVYAITWFSLAAMLAGATIVIGRREWLRARR